MTEPLTDVDIKCRSCAGTYDACLASRDDCCPDCTHYDDDSSDGDSVDEVAVDRACSGDRTLTLNRAETAEAWRRLEASGLSASRIQEVLGVTSRSVQRWRSGRMAPISRRGTTPGGPDVLTTETIRRGQASDDARIRKAATKASEALRSLDALLSDYDGKKALRERVARLERELQRAKAELRGGVKEPSQPSSVGSLECRKGCGKVVVNAAGRAAHERSCTYEAVAA